MFCNHREWGKLMWKSSFFAFLLFNVNILIEIPVINGLGSFIKDVQGRILNIRNLQTARTIQMSGQREKSQFSSDVLYERPSL